MRIVLPEALRELAGGHGVVELSCGTEAGAAGPAGDARRTVGGIRHTVGGVPSTVGDARHTVGGVPSTVGDSPQTVGGVLGALRALQPGLYDRLVTEQGALRPHVNIFVDGENIRFSGGLDTAVGEGSEIFVLPAISGG